MSTNKTEIWREHIEKPWDHRRNTSTYWIQNPFLTAQSTQIKSVISVPIKDFIHHYPRALFNDIPRVGAHFYDIPGSGRTFTTYPGPSTYWNTIHGQAHKRPPQQDNNYITFKDNTHINPKDIASAFNKQFINTIPHKTNTTNRKITRKVLSLQPTQINITTEQVLAAIKNNKNNNSTGPDNINIKHLKTLARTNYNTSQTYTTL